MKLLNLRLENLLRNSLKYWVSDLSSICSLLWHIWKINCLRSKENISEESKELILKWKELILNIELLSRSLLHVTADVISADGKVVATCTDKGVAGATKTERAENAGVAFADVLKSKKITAVAFDRNGYLYHGRVKAFAEGLRKGGIQL